MTETKRYDESLMRDFATRFFGYGSLKSDLWLIGPEVVVEKIQMKSSTEPAFGPSPSL